MEPIELPKLDNLDQNLLATDNIPNEARFVHDAIKSTSELLLQEKELGSVWMFRIAVLIESQLRLRLLSNVKSFNKDLSSSLTYGGLCSIDVILHTLEAIAKSKEIYNLSLLRVQ